MNIKKMFIGLITSIALVFVGTLTLQSNILEASSYGVDNLSTQRSYEGWYKDTTTGGKLPTQFTDLETPNRYDLAYFDSNGNILSNTSNKNKHNFFFNFAGGDTPSYTISGMPDYEDENFNNFIGFKVDSTASITYDLVEFTNTGNRNPGFFTETKILDKGIYLIGDWEITQYQNPDYDEFYVEVIFFMARYDETGYRIESDILGLEYSNENMGENTPGYHLGNIVFDVDLTIDGKVPGISGESTVINNVDKPYTVERIKQIAMLSAKDDYFGDLTEEIEIVRDDYTANNKKIGNYEIEFRVENPAGLSANFILIVANRDLVAPVITGPGTSTMSYTEKFVLSNLMAKFTVKDNHDTGVKLVHLEDDFEQGKPGVYTFRFSATDASKNESIFVHTMTVVDDQKAIITDSVEGPIEVNWRDKVTNEMLLVGLTAHDEISGELTDRLKVTNNPIKKELGTYQVEYEVIDDAGNVSKYTRTYKVITTDAPIFYVSKNLILISDVNLLTTKQLVAELARYENIQYASHMVIENEYEGNEYVVGTYKIKVAINDTKGVEHIVQRSIQVFEDSEELNPQLSLWQKIVKFFKDAWNLIKKVAITIWNAIMWLPRLIINFFKKKSVVLFLSL